MVVEMSLGERHVDIAGFADRFAVIEDFEHRKQAGVLLQQAGQRIDVARAPVTAQSLPFWLGAAGGFDGCVHVALGGL